MDYMTPMVASEHGHEYDVDVVPALVGAAIAAVLAITAGQLIFFNP